jgi:hypothetical protein
MAVLCGVPKARKQNISFTNSKFAESLNGDILAHHLWRSALSPSPMGLDLSQTELADARFGFALAVSYGVTGATRQNRIFADRECLSHRRH